MDAEIKLSVHTMDEELVEELKEELRHGVENTVLVSAILSLHQSTLDLVATFQVLAAMGKFCIEPRDEEKPTG